MQGTRRHQELDPETGLYAFPARNYDPRTSRWLSADPALEEYLPKPGQKPGDLVGMGGVYNYANLAVYHYGGNNPLKYVDPTGEFFDGATLGKVAAKVMTKGVAGALAGLAAIALGIGAGVAAGNAISRAITQNQQQNEPQAAPQTAPATASARAGTQENKRSSYSVKIQIQGSSIQENRRRGSKQGSHEITIGPSNRPITREQAQGGLREVMGRLSPDERERLAPAIVAASSWIERAANSGGTGPTSERFEVSPKNRDGSGDRIDLITFGERNIVKP